LINPTTGPWRLADLAKVPKNGRTVFSTFHCGGGSTMGYKLAGFTVLGGVEIDPEMSALYVANHNPRYEYLEAIQTFNERAELPDDLYNLDILDGSPPCSVFSMAGKREKKWGVEAYFREGQRAQRLDDLFFHYIALAKRLQPKVVIAENVKGLILGNAKGYVREIFDALTDAGYDSQLFLLNSSRMGVPQKRERTFFIARRKDLGLPALSLAFNEPPVTIRTAIEGCTPEHGKAFGAMATRLWHRAAPGQSLAKVHDRGAFFTHVKLHPDKPANTLVANSLLYHWDTPRCLTSSECIRIQTFPEDYARGKYDDDMQYVCGMSVPPFMMQRIALEIGRQWFGHEYDPTPRPLA
jgi:DNA (cytosine-5)-methyltransferase 1